VTVTVRDEAYTADPIHLGIRGVQALRTGGLNGRRFVTVGGIPFDATVAEFPLGKKTLVFSASKPRDGTDGIPDLTPTLDAMLASLQVEPGS
jgi:hypothetical protein